MTKGQEIAAQWFEPAYNNTDAGYACATHDMLADLAARIDAAIAEAVQTDRQQMHVTLLWDQAPAKAITEEREAIRSKVCDTCKEKL